jgi:hypothetical protein
VRRLILTCCVLATHAAYAQSGDAPTAPTPPATPVGPNAQHTEATDLFDQGRKLLEQGQFAEACAKFDDSIRLDPTAAGTMLNLGLCNERLGKLKTALFWFRRGQTRAAETNLPDAERAAKDHTADLALKVATVHIAFGPNAVAGATVKIDDDVIKPDDYGRVEVDPGHHTLVAGAPGMRIVRQEFDVSGTGGQTLTIQFVAGNNTLIVDPGHGRRMASLYVLIGGGVLLVACIPFDVIVKNNYCDQFTTATGTGCGSGQKLTGDRKAASTDYTLGEWMGNGMFFTGLAAVGAAAYLYFTAPQPEHINQTVFAPSVAPDHVGFALTGHF